MKKRIKEKDEEMENSYNHSHTKKHVICRTLNAIPAIFIVLSMQICTATYAESLDLSLSTYSTQKIKKLLNDPKTWQSIPKQVVLCVYSPNGENSEAFQQATRYISELPRIGRVAKDFGVNLQVTRPSNLQIKINIDYPKLNKKAETLVKLNVYTDERVLTEDFRSKKCDGAGISNLRARQFNPFVGSIDALGAVQNNKQMTAIIQLLARHEFDQKMINQDYEVVGIIPVGAAYIMVNDRNINTLAKAAGKKVAVFQFDPTQRKLVQNVGAQPVSVDLTSVGGKFNNKQVDIIAGPALLFQPLELNKGMTDKSGKVVGGIIRFPLIQVTGTLIMHRNKFPAGMGSIAREVIAKQLTPAFEFIDKIERDIPTKYWLDVPEADKPGYIKIMREARIQMTKEGYYNQEMMHLLKQIRCSQNPSNYECALKDE
ncbi:hypothetical protein F952_00037 [Acinetobacter baylyi DSM 14961 = CIP 107474]|nr:hypothetical protein F952_00037 [Acinetobacter baylyi DSM 14961 = CIP 107474]